MKLALKWMAPILLRLLSLSQVSLANPAASAAAAAAAAAWGSNPGSVQLVTGFFVGLAVNSQPRVDLSLDDATTTFVQLANHELSLPIMPLHLLGKKSWNVYNQANISRVQADEAAAAAREAAEDERKQEIDSQRRLAILRGEQPSPLPTASSLDDENEASSTQHPPRDSTRSRKKRKRTDEDDTDFELRLAKAAASAPPSAGTVALRPSSTHASLTDHNGHISLFPPSPPHGPAPAPGTSTTHPPTAPLQNTFLSSASGAAPWYTTTTTPSEPNPPAHSPAASTLARPPTQAHGPWGTDEDAQRRRRERAAARTASQDPLAAMRQGAAVARQVERERRAWVAEKEREVGGLNVWRGVGERERKQGHGRRERRGGDGAEQEEEDEGLEGFHLDGGLGDGNERDAEKRRRHDHGHGHSSERDRSGRRSHRHRDGDGEGDRTRRRERDGEHGHSHRHRHHHHHRH